MFNTFIDSLPAYRRTNWRTWDYSILNNSPVIHRQSNIDHLLYSRLVITADTETSKGEGTEDNHIVIWAVHIQFEHNLIVTLYGRKPSELPLCLQKIKNNIPANKMYVFWHNLGYDWVFTRKFILKNWDVPEYQLNLKPHCPILIEFMNGITMRDSLPLAQRSLDKWGADLCIEHSKRSGSWDYDKIRHQQGTKITSREMGYLEYDVLALGDCLQKTMDTLKCNITTLPYTATGIPRRDTRRIGKKNHAKHTYNNCKQTYDEYIMSEKTYHGGYTHANRYFIDYLVQRSADDPVKCKDFNSSYPARLILDKMPMEGWTHDEDFTIEDIVEASDDYAFMFNLHIVNADLKNGIVMPVLQFSKCTDVLNGLNDNGRLLHADIVEIPVTEIDLKIILEQYTYSKIWATDIMYAEKDYLPRWLTDYIYSLYEDKCKLKGGDPVIYDIQKAKLNSVYG